MPFVEAGNLREQYDCVVVGAGPAGLNAARRLRLSAPGISLLLVDRAIPWECPKACAEGVGRAGFAENTPVRQSWIRHRITSVAFHSPSGETITYTDERGGYIIDRALMQRDIAAECAEAGVDVLLGERVQAVSPWGEQGRAVRLQSGPLVSAQVVVDAAGASSPLGRDEPITWKAYDPEPAFFVVADGVEHDTAVVHLHVGQRLAPGGYGWMFPGAGDTVNIGVLVGSAQRGTVNIRNLLDSLLSNAYPQARVHSYHAGVIACGYRRGPLALQGLIKAGDAANTTNPMSRAGICEALRSGLAAAACALEMLDAGSEREVGRCCRRYEAQWYRVLGKRHAKLLDTKDSLQRIPDRDYDTAVKTLAAIPQSKLTMARIFRVALQRFPRLVWAMRHLM